MIFLCAVDCLDRRLLPSNMFSPQDHRSSSSLILHIPNFRPRGMRDNLGICRVQTDQWGLPWVASLEVPVEAGVARWQSVDTLLPDSALPLIQTDLCETTNDRLPSGPLKGPSSSNNQAFQYTNRREPEHFTRYDNPVWGDSTLDDAYPKMGNQGFQESNSNPRS